MQRSRMGENCAKQVAQMTQALHQSITWASLLHIEHSVHAIFNMLPACAPTSLQPCSHRQCRTPARTSFATYSCLKSTKNHTVCQTENEGSEDIEPENTTEQDVFLHTTTTTDGACSTTHSWTIRQPRQQDPVSCSTY